MGKSSIIIGNNIYTYSWLSVIKHCIGTRDIPTIATLRDNLQILAEHIDATNRQCRNCVNIFKCNNCMCCVNCLRSSYCTDSVNCSGCTSCNDCKYCVYCRECYDCYACDNSSSCTLCHFVCKGKKLYHIIQEITDTWE